MSYLRIKRRDDQPKKAPTMITVLHLKADELTERELRLDISMDCNMRAIEEVLRGEHKGIRYVKVAEIRSGATSGDDLERAYELTNHIDHDWTLNSDVVAFGTEQRSSMMGDVLIRNSEFGMQVFAVARIGMKPIADVDVKALLEKHR